MAKRKIKKLENMISKLKVNDTIAQDDKDLNDILDIIESLSNSKIDIYACNSPVIGLLLNKNFGLREIKKEIIAIEKKLYHSHFSTHKIISIIKNINELLINPYFGLEEIKKEIRDIEDKLDHPDSGLEEIKQEIREVEDKLDHPDFGLEEIKQEIREVEDKLDQFTTISQVLTTGPVVADNNVNSIVSKVLNNTDEEVAVTVRLFDIGTCPDPKTLVEEEELTIDPKCAQDFIFPKPPTQWEIEYEGIVSNVFVFTAGRTDEQNVVISESNFNPANTFRHSEHVPTQVL